MILRLMCIGAVLAAALPCAPAHSADPKVPLGRDPGGIAVALVSAGIDYTVAEIARRLARDGEGDIVGWDFADNDNRPFAAHGEGTSVAYMLSAMSFGRLVPVRVDPANPASLARAVAFVARTPARIAAVSLWSGRREDWEPFREAASHFKQMLFVVAAGQDEQSVWPAALKLDNMLAVAIARADVQRKAPGVEALIDSPDLSHPTIAIAAAAGIAACLLQAHPSLADGAALKQRLLASGTPSETYGGARVLSGSVCPHGGKKP
ncbi:MAG: hypothetical protein ACREC6_14010 [Hyphomicrobiaceae bacterium]